MPDLPPTNNPVGHIAEAVREGGFRQLWEDTVGLMELYKFVKEIQMKVGEKPFTYPVFYEGWSARNVMADDYDQAFDEMVNLVAGWW